jgi:hypothetical protein
VSDLYLVAGRAEIARRRARAGPRLVEAWPDLEQGPDLAWIGADDKAALDAAGPPLPVVLAVTEDAVPVYYGPALRDLDSLPDGQSLRGRVLSARGVAVAWITYGPAGERSRAEPAGPADPTFHLRRPGRSPAHLWRLFRRREDALAWAREERPGDPEAGAWAAAIPARDFEDLLARFARRP